VFNLKGKKDRYKSQRNYSTCDTKLESWQTKATKSHEALWGHGRACTVGKTQKGEAKNQRTKKDVKEEIVG